MNYTLQEIQKEWQKTTFLNRLIFLMNEFEFSQDKANEMAKKEFKEIKKELNKLIKGV